MKRIYSALQIHLFWFFILLLSERKENNKEKILIIDVTRANEIVERKENVNHFLSSFFLNSTAL